MAAKRSSKKKTAPEHYVLLVPGIRDVAHWQNRVSRAMQSKGLNPVSVRLGFYDVISFLSPWEQSSRAYKKLSEAWDSLPKEQEVPPLVSVVCHSFGAWLVTQFINDTPECRLYRIVCCGAVAKEDFKWREVRAKIGIDTAGKRVDPVGTKSILNHIGVHDPWPLRAATVHSRYGLAGWRGFDSDVDVANVWYKADHSTFLSDTRFTDDWISFLSGQSAGAILGTAEPAEAKLLERLLPTLRGLPQVVRCVVAMAWILVWLWPVTLLLIGLLLWYVRKSLLIAVLWVLATLGFNPEPPLPPPCGIDRIASRYRATLEALAEDRSELISQKLTGDQKQFEWTISNKTERHIAVFVRDYAPNDVPEDKRAEAWVRYDLPPGGGSRKLVLEDEFDSIKYSDEVATTGRVMIAVFDLEKCDRVFGPEPRRLLPTIEELAEHRKQPNDAEISVFYDLPDGRWRVACDPLW